MRLLTRLLAVVALLAVPLGLAVASQALADRPGPPSFPAEPVVIEEAGPPPPADPTEVTVAPSEPAPVSPSEPAPVPPSPPSPASPPAGPEVVEQAPIPVDDDDADEDLEDLDD